MQLHYWRLRLGWG